MIDLLLPYPPTVNHYWMRGRHSTFISTKGRHYRRSVEIIVAAHRVEPLVGPLFLGVSMTPPDRRRRDIDNILKPLLDALQHAGCYEDDCQIEHLNIVKLKPTKPGGVRVNVIELGKKETDQ